MKIQSRHANRDTVIVTSDWTTYTVVFSGESAQILSTGLSEECDTSHFPDAAKNQAIAVYLIAQLELQSLEG